jgi:hypothetical protein
MWFPYNIRNFSVLIKEAQIRRCRFRAVKSAMFNYRCICLLGKKKQSELGNYRIRRKSSILQRRVTEIFLKYARQSRKQFVE